MKEKTHSRELEDREFLRFLSSPVKRQLEECEDVTGLKETACIRVEGECRGRCIFCYSEEGGRRVMPIPPSLLEGAEGKRIRRLIIAGTEPLLHPGIRGLLEMVRPLGPGRVEVMASGDLLSSKGEAERVMEWGITDFSIPLYGSRAEVHELLSGRRDFAPLLQGLKNILDAGGRVWLHTILTTINLMDMRSLLKFAEREFGITPSIIPLRDKPQVFFFPSLFPPYSEVLHHFDEVEPGPPLPMSGFPLCVVKRIGVWEKGGEEEGYDLLSPSMHLYLRSFLFEKYHLCTRCPEITRCPGAAKGYALHHGFKGIGAIDG